jgi:hypothetical protein
MAGLTYADYVNKGRIAAVLSEALHINLYDSSSLRGAMTFHPYTAGGSTTMNVTTSTRGYAMAPASSETSGGFTVVDPTASQFQLTIARYGLFMRPTDLFRITQTGSPFDIDYAVGMLSESLNLTLTDLLCTLFPNVSGNVGSTTVNADTDDVYDGIYTLMLANAGAADIMAVLHGQQINDIMGSIRAEGGAAQYRQDTQAAVAASGIRANDGYRFSFAGVDFHQCDSVPTANTGADRQGAMFVPGAFGYTLGNVSQMDPNVDPADIILGTSEMFIERSRDAQNAQSDLIANSYPGVVEQEDARAVKFTTDA